MDYNQQDEQLKELLLEFEGALREHLKTSEEFQSLVEYLTKKHGTISLYVAAQIMGARIGTKRKRKAKKKAPPIRYELTKNDMQFLRSLKISTDIGA